jgi:prevent-host-death family protein
MWTGSTSADASAALLELWHRHRRAAECTRPLSIRSDYGVPFADPNALLILPFWPTIVCQSGGLNANFSAKDAKYNFGELIDPARAAPVTVAKYGRPVVVVMAVEEYKRLKGLDATTDPPPAGQAKMRRAKQ